MIIDNDLARLPQTGLELSVLMLGEGDRTNLGI